MKLKFKKFLTNFILAQLIITIVMLPILAYWGLEISLMAIIGNLIFSPFLTLFLILSSLIFFTEICGIYNIPLIYLLNKVTLFWNSILEQNSKSWMVGFVKPPMLLILPITILAFIAIKHPRIKAFTHKFSVLSFFLVLTIIFLKSWPIYFAFSNESFSLQASINRSSRVTCPEPCRRIEGNNKLLISKDQSGKISVVDNGFFNQTKTIEKATEFEIKPFLIQNLGTTKIDNLIIQKPSGKSFDGAKFCCKILNVKKVILPIFTEKLSKQNWRAFFDLRRFLTENKIIFERF